jgi:dihydropyrimidinase/dihydroorotase/allantoinase
LKGHKVIDLAVVNGTLINPFSEEGDAPQPATVAIKQGLIQAILEPGATVDADQVLDAEGMLILPGAIDIHFHCRAPAFPARGDFASETRAAAAGGVTTVFEMPISKPGASTVAIWEARRRLAERDAYVNVGLYGAPGLLDAAEIQGMARAGAVGFKLFLTRAPAGREDEFEGLVVEKMSVIAEALELIRPTGLRCAFHAEDQSLVDYYTAQAGVSDVPEFKLHGLSRPAVVESTAIAALIALASELKTPIHIVHVSTKMGEDLVRYARSINAPVTAETCPQYLLFTEDILEQVGPYGKINPPLRHAEDCEALWQALADGVLDVVTTDHSPFTAEEKEAAWGNILDAPPGHPGVEALVPLVLTEALNGRFSLARAVELISTKPAQLFNLFPRKGIIQPDAEADLTVYDPRGEGNIDRTTWQSRAAECNRLYDGLPTRGQVHATIVGGKVVYRAGRILGQPGDGRIVRPITPSP